MSLSKPKNIYEVIDELRDLAEIYEDKDDIIWERASELLYEIADTLEEEA